MPARTRLSVLLAIAALLVGGFAARADGPRQSARPSPALSPLEAIACEIRPRGGPTVHKAQLFCPYGVGYYCYTQYGSCPMMGPQCIGAPCWCPTAFGPVWGTVN